MNKLNSKISALQSDTQTELVSVESMLKAAQGDSSELEGLLKTQLNSVIDKQKDKLLDKLKSKFGQ